MFFGWLLSGFPELTYKDNITAIACKLVKSLLIDNSSKGRKLIDFRSKEAIVDHALLATDHIGKAIAYFTGQYPGLQAIFGDGRIGLDNNRIEDAICLPALEERTIYSADHTR